MSILKSMNIGISGLQANGVSMAVIGDNIANVNTMGYKASRANFSDVLARTALGIGDGVAATSVQQQFTQGTLSMTGNPLDMAIAGDGFLVVNGNVGGQNGNFYTRAGQFIIDNEGFISSMEGLRLQGYEADANGDINGALGDLMVAGVTAPPAATEQIDIRVNLDPSADTTVVFDPADPSNTSHFSSSVTVYDSLGNPIPANIYYNRTSDGEWSYNVMVDGEYLQGGTTGTPEVITSGTMSYDTDGNMTDHTQGATTFNPVGATQPQDLVLTFDGSTQYAGESTIRFMSQDGFAAGELVNVEVESDGTVFGIFSNGESQALGQVAMADFASVENLARMGNNLWSETRLSGQAIVGEPGTGGRGTVVAGALEGSNVDLAHEFVKMIAAQRGFQANSRIITTGDTLLQEIIQLKR